MKLISCYVSSFGKLKDFSYDFSNGLNTIKQDNGWGKSTLATFIKAMFYGLNSSKRSVAENERIKFRPWNSIQKFGGHIEFEWGGNEYKIERYFGSKESEDTVRLFDLKTGKEFANTENLGKRIFEIDEQGFFSTTYFSQKDFEIKSNSSLTAKFNSVCDIQDNKAFDDALEMLESKAKTYKYRGDKGLIPDLKREIIDVEYELEKSAKSLQALNTIKDEIVQLQGLEKDLGLKINLKTKEISSAGETQANIVKKQHYEQLLVQKQQLQTAIEKTNFVFNGNKTTKKEIEGYLVCNQDLLTAKTNQEILKNDIEILSQGKEDAQVQKKAKNNKNLVLLSVILAIISFGAYFINFYIGAILTGLTIILAILLLVLKNKAPQKSGLNQQLDLLIEEKKQALIRYEKIEGEITSVIDEFLSRFNLNAYLDRANALNQILDVVNENDRLKEQLVDINEKLKAFNVQNFSNLNLAGRDIDLLRQELQSLQNEYSKLVNELANKKSNLVYHENLANATVDLESKRAELVQKLESFSNYYKVLTTTIEYLKKADENLKTKYKEPLQDSLNKYLSKIAVGGFNAQIDIDLNVFVQEKDGAKDTDYYSKGYQNLIEICKRFALTDVLFKKEKPFIILDDPFYNLDDQKIENAIALINQLSKEYQIIYFICHESRRG